MTIETKRIELLSLVAILACGAFYIDKLVHDTVAVVAAPVVEANTVANTVSVAVTQSPNISLPGAATTTLPENVNYIEINDSCGPYYEGACVNVRSGPGTEFPSVAKLRTHIVLRISDRVLGTDGQTWYKITFDEWVRYPDRVAKEWYVSAQYVEPFYDIGPQYLATSTTTTTTKRIVIDRSDETLYAYDGVTLFMKEKISAGLDGTPTPRGLFNIYKKTPSRYMQGPVPGISDQEFDLPGVPWTMYFTAEGGAIHGAYWHDHFGEQWSHGCVNLPPEKAKELYYWADLGTQVTVRD